MTTVRCTGPTSSTFAATKALGSTWSHLDMTALGRQETWEDSPAGYPQSPPYAWWDWNGRLPLSRRRRWGVGAP